ncbi:MAG: hypothetical protein WCK67_04075 [bacterium]
MVEVLDKSIASMLINSEIQIIDCRIEFITYLKQIFIKNLARAVDWNKIFDFSLNFLLKMNLISIKVKNIENLSFAQAKYPDIYYCLQGRTLDLIISYILSKHVICSQMMLNFDSKKELNEANNLYSCIEFLRRNKGSVWVGIDKKPTDKIAEAYSYGDNMSYICSNLSGINILPISHKFKISKKIEIYFEVGKPIILGSNDFNEEELSAIFEQEIKSLANQQKEQIINNDFSGYDYSLI